MHVSKLGHEDHSDESRMVNIPRKVHVDFVGADIGVFGGVDPCEVLVLDEGWAVRRRQRNEGDWALYRSWRVEGW